MDSKITRERRPITSIQSEIFKSFSKARKAVGGLENKTRETIDACIDSMSLLQNRIEFDDELGLQKLQELEDLKKDFINIRTEEDKALFLNEVYMKAKNLLAYNKRIWDKLGYFTEDEMDVMNITMGVDGKVEGVSPAVPKDARHLKYEGDEDEFDEPDDDEE